MAGYKEPGSQNPGQKLEGLKKRYNDFKSQGLKLDMSRGKPCREQLDLSTDMLKITDYISEDGTDCRNYGMPDGLPQAKGLFAELLGVKEEEIILSGNSSLNIMHDIIARALLLGVDGGSRPWGAGGGIKFLCPSPGYDRHFAICELYGIEMIPVDMKNDGPDMDTVGKLASSDEKIKGIWCVPVYSNPEGIVYSDETVTRLAGMKTAAVDFRIFWDNAYAFHHLDPAGKPAKVKNILDACRSSGNPDRAYIFGSTSKMTFAGAGIAMAASSAANIRYLKKLTAVQTIGPDKLNELRHAVFFKNTEGVYGHMKKHAAILKPKFDMVISILEKELGGKGIASWNKPGGGYFISLDVMDNCAGKIIGMALEAGVTFTKAGATFPYGRDPRDRNIRIAPTYPPLDELGKAIELLCICVQIVCMESLLP